MASTFFGLETAKRGMYAQQSALYVTGHNISNANTPGYTRQRANFATTTPYPSSGLNRPSIPGQFGTGVQTSSIERIRNSFLDTQFRTQNNNMGYYGGLSTALNKMEDIMNEPSTSGLQANLDEFWKSLQTLAANTENSGARDVVASSGQMVADTFNYYQNSLERIQKDLGSQIDVKEKEINDTIASIAKLNKQIAAAEPVGLVPNDLYDERDVLVDKLSGLINIEVEKVVPYEEQLKNSGISGVAVGLYNINLVKADGTKVNLIEVTEASGIGPVQSVKVEKDADNMVTGISVGGTMVTVEDMGKSGELLGIINGYGYIDNAGNVQGSYPEMLKNLNNMAEAFAREFNAIHRQGYALGSDTPSGIDFFVFESGNAAKSIKVNQAIKDDKSLIAAASNPGGDSGDNKNAQLLADLKTKKFDDYIIFTGASPEMTRPTGMTGTIDSFYAGIIGNLGVVSRSANQDFKNAVTNAASIEQNRQSVSSVSLDEEMTNMIRFQHAYNAAARNITVVDEMLDKIINGMGVVGR